LIIEHELTIAVMGVEFLSRSGPVWGIEEEEIVLLASFYDGIEIATLEICSVESGGYITQVALTDGPPAILSTISDIELTVRIMAPHTLETGPVQVKSPGRFGRNVKVFDDPGPYGIITAFGIGEFLITLPDFLRIITDPPVEINEFLIFIG